MKLLFDLYNAQPFGSSKFHGGGEYIKTVFKSLIEVCKIYNHKHIEISVFFNKNKFLDDWLIELIKDNSIKVYDVKNEKDIQKILMVEYDVFYTGMPYMYSKMNLSMIRFRICTIHGIRSIEKVSDKYSVLFLNTKNTIKIILKTIIKKFYIKEGIKKYSNLINNFDFVITDSNHSKYALMVWLNRFNEEKLGVFYAPNKYYEIINSSKNIYGKYFLLVSVNRWEKNAYRALKAFELLFSKGYLNDYKVVVVGNLPKKIKRRLKYDKYIFKGYVEADELENLYNNCEVFVYPTLNEGFGMPPLEAMKYGKTCIVSCVCSLQEVCGDAVYYINPYDIEEIANRILKSSKEKIDKSQIFSQYYKISKKQDEDLKKICKLIIRENENVKDEISN